RPRRSQLHRATPSSRPAAPPPPSRITSPSHDRLMRPPGRRVAISVARLAFISLTERVLGNDSSMSAMIPPVWTGRGSVQKAVSLAAASGSVRGDCHTAFSTCPGPSRRRRQAGDWAPCHQRLLAAQRRLEATTESVDTVADAVGLGSAATLRLHFRRALRTSPVSYHRRLTTKARA